MDDNTNCPGGYNYHPWPASPRHWRLHAKHMHLFHGDEMSEIHKLKNALQAADYLNRQLHQELEQTKTNYHALYQVFCAATIEGGYEPPVTVEALQKVYSITREYNEEREWYIYHVEIVDVVGE